MNILIVLHADDRLSYRLVQQGLAHTDVVGEVRQIGIEPVHVYTYPAGGGQGASEAWTRGEAVDRMADLLEEIESPVGESPVVEVVAHLLATGARTTTPVTPCTDAEQARLAAPGGDPGRREAAEVVSACRARFPAARHVLVWDDAFFAELPAEAREYLLPEDLGTRLDLVRRGTRGLLHAAAVARGVAALVPPRAARTAEVGEIRLAICLVDRHCGVTAVRGGRPLWTTFGLVPGDGLPGLSAVGRLDPGVLEALVAVEGPVPDALFEALRVRAGLGVSDPADLERLVLEAQRGVEPARTRFAAFLQALAGGVAGALLALGGLDGLVFVGGGAVASPAFRAALLARLAPLGFAPPLEVPLSPQETTRLSPDGARPAVFVVPAQEHDLVVREVTRAVGGSSPGEDQGSGRPTVP